MNRWLVVGVDCGTGKRGIIASSAFRDTALAHKADLEEQRPLQFAGVTVEYGDDKQTEWLRTDIAPLVHFSLIEDEPAGLCWPEDHYPDEPQQVSEDISKVTCSACREHYHTLNDLKKVLA
jgi:hypothetical protein